MSPRKPVNPGAFAPFPILKPPPPAACGGPDSAPGPGAAGFPIVVLGAAAGGLAALKKFFAGMPAGSGSPGSRVALVIILQPGPGSRRLLPSALGRLTPLEVLQAKDGMRLEPGRVYLNPPGGLLGVRGGAFKAVDQTAAGGARPIDFFFKSLAGDLAAPCEAPAGERHLAIAVILSGTGSDGSLGLNAIHAGGGVTIVQEPSDATYEGMPRRALATGLVDHVLAAAQIPELLLKYVSHPGRPGELERAPVGPGVFDCLQQILLLIRRETGHDFSHYKQSTVLRRIKRRMGVHQITDPGLYLDTLRHVPSEAVILFHELLIGVTSFFRDAEAFAAVKDEVLPRLVEKRPGDEPLRIWVVGCSTGEEAFSLAMLIAEYKRESGREFPVQIFASDIDSEAITRARRCRYPRGIADHVSPERLKLFFRKEGDGYRVSKEIRNMVVFAVQSVIRDPPFSKLDLISCRNLLIYLDSELQKKIILLFHYALNPDGFLLLGSAESVGEFTGLFYPRDKKQKIYRRIENQSPRRPMLHNPTCASPASWPGTFPLGGRGQEK